jgi:large subunit ribosomal protein L10
MPKTKSEKKKIIEKLNDKLGRMKSAIMFNFSGIAVNDLDKLREKCRQEEIDYMVAKKTLLRKSLSDQGLGEVAENDFTGEVATLFSYEDEVAPARILADFAKTNKNIKFVGGVFEGKFADVEKVVALSKIPGKKELLAKLVGCISNPMSGLARVINAIKEEKEKQSV